MTMPDTPMMRQYKRLKQEAKDAILFFRLGDFYEMFQEDAQEVSTLLNLTLTKRNGVPMCGIPYHASRNYVGRLLKAGKKIAICEQVTLPKGGKGIADRQIMEILTPGTVLDQEYLDQRVNNYLCSLGKIGTEFSLCYVDPSTGEFRITSFPDDGAENKLREEFARIKPSEIIVQESLHEEKQIFDILKEHDRTVINRYPDWNFDITAGFETIKRHFGVINLKGFGLEEHDPALFAAGILIEYLQENTQNRKLTHIRTVHRYRETDFVTLDESTQRNLELIYNMFDGTKRYTLLEVLDFTKTSSGARKLKNWILHPLQDIAAIEKRLEKTEILYRSQMLLSSIRELLASILDLERLAARVSMDKAHAKDLLAIKNSLSGFFRLYELIEEWQLIDTFDFPASSLLSKLNALNELLERSIHEDPSTLLTEGRLIKTGYSQDLDELAELKSNSRKILDSYLRKEKEETGINSLKIRYNKIIGHYLEVTKANLPSVPEHFIRRQSLVNSERFTTETLIDLETNLNNASEKIIDLEKELFLAVREEVKSYIVPIYTAAAFLSEVDCIASFAKAATLHGFSKPDLLPDGTLSITEGRHPVVEHHLPQGEFIPNDLRLDTGSTFFSLITGPNMAGKSTFLRQNALIVLMAQIGSFVPAAEARIGVVDKLFCRVGATDNLARGESTFLVEMSEAAYILRTATEQSFIIMDEIGRGTATTDGLSIAWAITEHMLSSLKARTLFATHFHELTLLNHPGMSNYYLEVLEKGDEIIFLKKVKKGSANNSYGIHVARLAGVPVEVVRRAAQLLKNMAATEQKLSKRKMDRTQSPGTQPSQPSGQTPPQEELFSESELVLDKIKAIDINTITPLQALNLLQQWKDELSG
jgi:DNA mismatch repair protein MutS